jgi:hypothetical protein
MSDNKNIKRSNKYHLPQGYPWQKAEQSIPVDLLCGDRLLVAVPLSNGGYDYCVITAQETGFDDESGSPWCAWGWDDVEHYCLLDPRKPGAES